jgi:cell wall-associated NlpC family hydrolase
VGVTGLRLHHARRLGELPAGADLTIGVAAAARPWARATTGPLGFNVPAVGAGESSLGARAASIAQQYLGIPYLWGGANPKVGLDCSGLTMLVYGRLGIKLAHFTGLQWQEGTHVGRNVEPGDLVFFEPTVLGPGHVGIYMGGGRFIEAPHTGDVVKIASLRSPNYALSYVGAVRPY